jgi:hypothetical protein
MFTELGRRRLNRIRYHDPDHAIPEEARGWRCGNTLGGDSLACGVL